MRASASASASVGGVWVCQCQPGSIIRANAEYFRCETGHHPEYEFWRWIKEDAIGEKKCGQRKMKRER